MISVGLPRKDRNGFLVGRAERPQRSMDGHLDVSSPTRRSAAPGGSRATRRDAPVWATQPGSLLCVPTAESIGAGYLLIRLSMSRESIRIISGRPHCLLGGPFAISTTRVKEVGALPRCLRHQHRLAASRSVKEWLCRAAANCLAGVFTGARGSATLMHEEEPESPGEVRSQSKHCLPSVDE